MRKFTKSLLTLALLVFAVGGANAGVEVKIPIELTGAVPGVTVKAINPATLEELAENPEHIYAAKFTTSDQLQNVIQIKNLSTVDAVAAGCDRIIIEFGAAVDNAWRFHSYGGQYDGIEEIGGETTHTLMLDGSKSSIDDFTIFNWVGSGVKEIIIKAAYFYKSPYTSLEFNAFGEATIGKGELTATGGLSYDASTGVLTSDGSAGTMTLEFATPVELSYLIHYEVKRSGTDGIISRLKFYEEDNTLINTWNGIKLDNNWQMPAGIDNNATNAFLTHKPVKKLIWESDAEASNAGKTLTINSIEFTLKTISCAVAGETMINTLAYKLMGGESTSPAWNMNTSTGLYYGSNTGDAAVSYADVTDYSEIRIYRKDNTGFRAFFINAAGTNVNNINHENAASTWNAEGKYWSIDLSKVEKYGEKVALQGIKSSGYGINDIVNKIVVYNMPAANAPQYTLSGSGMQLAETEAALADANATCIDATGVTGITTNSEAGRTLLTSANPNCLFLGTTGDGGLANTKNVITSGTCDNLVLTDGYPFKAPAAFTATNAKFTKPVSDAGYATMVVPFNVATLPGSGSVKAYELTGVSGEVITTNEVTSLTANEPVMIKAAQNAGYEFTATDASIGATGDGLVTNGLLKASYAGTTAAADATNYVLQKNGDDVNFYFVKTTAATVKPFRAYLDSTGPAPVLFLNLDNETTGIADVRGKMEEVRGDFFDLQGRKVAQPTKGMYIVNGKKYFVK